MPNHFRDPKSLVKRVLFVAYYFAPVAASGAMRPLGFCRYLEEYGWRPWILTTSPDSVYPPHPMDDGMMEKLPKTVKVDAVPYSGQLDRFIAWRNRLRGLLPRMIGTRRDLRRAPSVTQVSSGSSVPVHRKASALKSLVMDWAFSFPDPQCAWIAPALKHVASLPREQFPHAVLATGGPWSGLVLGWLVARRFGVPFLVDFRDPWASNAHFHFSSPYLRHKSKKLERRVCAAADTIIANTDELATQFRDEYPEFTGKCVVIPNGFHRDDFAFHDPEREDGRDEQASRQAIARGIELCHFGTMYLMRTPEALLQAMVELFDERKITSEQIRLRFVGVWDLDDPRCESLAQRLEKHGFLKREPPVDHKECLQQMTQADALLVMQPGSKLQVPAKIYEYLATQRPLVVVGDEGATFNLVKRNGLGRCCPNRVAEIKVFMSRLASGEVRLSAPSRDAMASFDYRLLSEKLAHTLDRACEHSNRYRA